jgi:signal transduction histidine kinase
MEILLVDDEEGIRKVLGISLADRGHQIHTAADGQEALAVFESHHPAIVMTDIKMPVMDGLELLKQIKRRNPETEVIMITGHGDIHLAIESLKFEATDFITKPIDEDILDVALKRACERIALRAQLRAYTENLELLVAEKSRRLIQAERLAAMGETVAGLAHAIKNISGGLKGGAFVVEKGLELNHGEYLNEGWRMVRDNVNRIQQLSLDLLDIAKPSIPTLIDTDPFQPLAAVYNLMLPQAREYGIELVLSPNPGIGCVSMDPENIHRCLLNLVTNSIDACSQASTVGAPPRVVLTLADSPDAVEYRVEDNGAGMEASLRTRLFQGFVTTKGSRGTGIGLMLTRKIVEAHGGEIAVHSEMGQGSIFTIRLARHRPK